MAVGGGVRVASSVEVWGRRRNSATTSSRSAARRGAATVVIRCSCVGEAEEHYRTLRLRPGATRGEVKKAFRRLALRYHPDVCKESDGGDDRLRRPVPADQRGVPGADEQHEGGREEARVLAAQVRPHRPGPRQVQAPPQRGRRRLVRHVKDLT